MTALTATATTPALTAPSAVCALAYKAGGGLISTGMRARRTGTTGRATVLAPLAIGLATPAPTIEPVSTLKNAGPLAAIIPSARAFFARDAGVSSVASRWAACCWASIKSACRCCSVASSNAPEPSAVFSARLAPRPTTTTMNTKAANFPVEMRSGAAFATTVRLPDEARLTVGLPAVPAALPGADVVVVFADARRVGLAVIFALGWEAARAAATPLPVLVEPERAVIDVALTATPEPARRHEVGHYLRAG